ncbi:hypothetical protein HY029_06335 [Candidatus Gottesmanbacteria bacterium]|nr:hypothetical protein [Candidatus Gottesmanbacteria bacterium]
MNNTSKFRMSYIIFGLGILIAVATAVYFFLQYQDVKQQLTNPANYTATESKTIIEKLGKLMELPTDEVPTVATISDKEKLKNQPFFVRAKNGDKVIIYTNAKRAILYDPIANKIIDVAPVNIGSPSATITGEPTIKISPTPTKKITPTPAKSG